MGNVNGQGGSIVDTDMSTVERIHTELERPNLSHLCLRYESKSMPECIGSHLPKSPIVKKVEDHILVGRSKNADVFLNDKYMSRNYIEIWRSGCDTQTFFIQNVSQSKSVKIDGRSLHHGELGTLVDKSELVLDYITFAVNIIPGDEESPTYIVSTECCDDLEHSQDIYIIRGDVLQNQGLYSGFTLIPGYPGSSPDGYPHKSSDRNRFPMDYRNGQILGHFSSPTLSKTIGTPSSNFKNSSVAPLAGLSPMESTPIYMYADQINNSFVVDSLPHLREPQEHSMMHEKIKRLPCEGVDNSEGEDTKVKRFCDEEEEEAIKLEQY